jgi:hypothetical protein
VLVFSHPLAAGRHVKTFTSEEWEGREWTA